MTATSRLCIFTRYPTPGAAKTRLIPALGPERAAALHARLTERAVAALRECARPVEVWTTGAPASAFREWLSFLRCGEDLLFRDQGSGDLGARMLRAVGAGPAIIVGSDVPGMTAAHVARATALLESHDAVFGPARDGGYWLVGMRRPLPALFADMPWGTGAVLAETQQRARSHGIAIALADTLDDLDTPDDLARWPELAACA
jgi:hypothetical protein